MALRDALWLRVMMDRHFGAQYHQGVSVVNWYGVNLVKTKKTILELQVAMRDCFWIPTYTNLMNDSIAYALLYEYQVHAQDFMSNLHDLYIHY